MLNELLGELNNWFDRVRRPGTYTVENGSITLPFLREGQYYRVLGSIFNDGVHCYGREAEGELRDESFTGAVWALAVPAEVVTLAADIAAWREKTGASAPYVSESLTAAGYSYTRAGAGDVLTWRQAFAPQCGRWRKL